MSHDWRDPVHVTEYLSREIPENGSLALSADATLAEVPAPEIVLVPGSMGRKELMDDGPVHEWLH